MYRLLFIVATVVVIALAIGYALHNSQKTSSPVTSLLPRETVAFLHLPDLTRAREDWHHSDLYQLYTEPTVQEFLRKPLSRLHTTDTVSQSVRDVEHLDPKDAFVAILSAHENDVRVAAGFRFRGSADEAEKVVSDWRRGLLGQQAAATPAETIDYQQHKIQVYRPPGLAVATVYAGHWFFAANNVDDLKSMIDRADGRTTDKEAVLSADANFREAMANMPASYAFCFYLQPRTMWEKLEAVQASSGRTVSPNDKALLSQIRSACATMRFDGGKMHDVFYVGMPQQVADAELTRNSLSLASPDAFVYMSSLVDVARQFALVNPSPSAAFLGSRLQKIGAGLSLAGVTPEQWKSIFGSEASAVADWPATVHWPSLLGAFPVHDFDKAKKTAGLLAHLLDDDGAWTEYDKDGVHYVSTPYAAGFITLRPTIGISEKFMVAGLDSGSVEAAMARANGTGASLSSSATYKRAAQTLPDPTNMFTYLDLGLLYTRLDAALRPMLMMSAAFMPAMNDYLDPAKLPPADVVRKHLGPTVSSQRYRNNGYIGESVGPVTMSQTAAAAVLAGVGAALGYQHSGLGQGGMFPSLLSPSLAPAPAAPSSGGWSGHGVKTPSQNQSPSPAGTP